MSTLAWCLLDADGAAVAERDAHRPFYAASTIKLAVLVAVARAVDAGRLHWDDTLAVRRRFRSGAAGGGGFTLPPDDRDDRLPAEGTPLSVRDLAAAAIIRSSNEATDILIDRLGLAAVDAALRAVGVDECTMHRRIGDGAAERAGLTNTVTAQGLARLLYGIVTGTRSSTDATATMVGFLRAQEYPCIAEVLTPATVWGSKSGWVAGIEHDVAFVGDPAAPGLAILAVCTEGCSRRDGRSGIHDVARALLPAPMIRPKPGSRGRPALR